MSFFLNGRRHYRADYIRFLTYSLASCDETKAHLALLYETDSLASPDRYHYFITEYRKLGAMIVTAQPGGATQDLTGF